MLRQMFIELAESWENYRAIGTTNKNHRVHKLIIDHIPEVLQSWISEKIVILSKVLMVKEIY
jgi:hypothetical protein